MAAPNRAPPLDDEIREKICKLVAEGMTRQQIAYRLGRSLAQVRKAIRELGGVEAIRHEAAERRQQRRAERDAEIAVRTSQRPMPRSHHPWVAPLTSRGG